MSNFNKSFTAQGLGTIHTETVPDTSIYAVTGKITLPTITQGSSAQSAVVTVVNVNGSPVYTGEASAEGFETQASCTAGDIITIVLSSSVAEDNALNAVKTTATISEAP